MCCTPSRLFVRFCFFFSFFPLCPPFVTTPCTASFYAHCTFVSPSLCSFLRHHTPHIPVEYTLVFCVRLLSHVSDSTFVWLFCFRPFSHLYDALRFFLFFLLHLPRVLYSLYFISPCYSNLWPLSHNLSKTVTVMASILFIVGCIWIHDAVPGVGAEQCTPIVVEKARVFLIVMYSRIGITLLVQVAQICRGRQLSRRERAKRQAKQHL